MGTKRYRLKIATWTVVREAGQPSPRKLDCPEAVVELARDLFRDQDDDREHFWAILLNAQNRYLLAHLVSTGTQSATLVHPREVLGPALREGAAALILIHNHRCPACRPEDPRPRDCRERFRGVGVVRDPRPDVGPVDTMSKNSSMRRRRRPHSAEFRSRPLRFAAA